MNNGSTSGAVAGDGGANPGNQEKTGQESNPNTTPNERLVKWEDHKRAIDDMLDKKARLKEAEEKIAELERGKLQEKEEYKTLYEQTKADVDKWKTEAENGKKLFKHTQKYNAVKKAALESGMLPEALDDLDLLDLDSIVVETTDAGRYAVHGVKEFVEKLKTNKAHWFKKADGPTVDSGGGGAPPKEPGPVTAQDVIKAERQWRMGKITEAEYHEIYTKYAGQTAQ